MTVLSIMGVITALVIIGIGYMITKAMPKDVKVPASSETEAAVPADGKKKKKKGNMGLAGMREKHKKGQTTAGDGTEDDVLPDDGAVSEEEVEKVTKKIGAKKAAKLEAKEERRLEQEAIKKEREEAKAREQERRAEEDQERAEAKEAEKKKEEEEALAAAEKKKKEQEEYDAMKSMFSVEEKGSVAETIQTESQGLLAEFVEYIKDTKVVMLEELATKFGLKTQDAKMRLENLEEMGQITGVMDDRGKYIYISEEEMNGVVKFIKQRGRVTLSDLSENSNKLIRLQSEKTK